MPLLSVIFSYEMNGQPCDTEAPGRQALGYFWSSAVLAWAGAQEVTKASLPPCCVALPHSCLLAFPSSQPLFLGHWPHFIVPRALSHPQLGQQLPHLLDLMENPGHSCPLLFLCSFLWLMRSSLSCCLPVLIRRSLLGRASPIAPPSSLKTSTRFTHFPFPPTSAASSEEARSW